MLRIIESFDFYGTLGATGTSLNEGLNTRHNGGGILSGVDGSLIAGRGDDALALHFYDDTSNKVLVSRYDPTQSDTWICGFAFKTPATLPTSNQRIWESYENQVILELRHGTLSVNNLSWTHPEVVDYKIRPACWYYIEIKVYHHQTLGTIEVRVNGETAYNVTNKDTINGSTDPGGTFIFTSPDDVSGTAFDDLYICDDTGADNNDFLGPLKVEVLRPSSDDGTQNWTPSAGGSHAGLVDNPDMWTATDYVEATGANVDDLWAYGDLTKVTGVINGVQLVTSAWTDTGQPRTLKAICDSGSTVEYSGARGIGADTLPASHEVIWETDPDTSAAWTVSGLNAASFGIRKV